jgi:2',3'-cyclic-nucleotide 2'-phosphodiesterase (5'-nucleotidase family)
MPNQSKSVFFLCVVLFVNCKTEQSIHPQISSNLSIISNYENNPEIDEIIKPYAKGLDNVMNEIIGFNPMFIEKQKPSSILGNMMADAILYKSVKEGYTVDFCILNYGGIRSSLDSGNITLGEIFELMPFENQITVLKISNEIAQDLLKHILEKGGEPMSEKFRMLRDIPKNQLYYYIAINDYMANGGDGYGFLSKATQRWDTKIKIRDALIDYIKTHNPLTLSNDKREL